MKRQIYSLVCAWLLITAGMLVAPQPTNAAVAPQLDRFVATDGTNLTAYSANWTVTAGAAIIQGNAVTWNNATLGVAFRNDVTWSANQSVTMTYVLTDNSGNSQIGPAVRCTAGNNGYLVQTTGQAPGFLRVAKVVAGALTTLWDSAGAGANPPPYGVLPGDQVTLQVIGTALNLYKNGVPVYPVGSLTDATFATGSAGIFGAGTAKTETATTWVGDSSPTATRTSANITNVGYTMPGNYGWTQLGVIQQVGDVVQFSLNPSTAYSYGGQIGGQVEIMVTGGPVIGGLYTLQWSGDAGQTWSSVAGVSNSISGTTVGQSNPIYSVVFGVSGLKSSLLQFGVVSAISIGSPLVIWACAC